MDIKKYVKDGLLKIKVRPNSSKTELVEENGGLKLYLKAVPDKNKANKELMKFFKKKFDFNVVIKSGIKGRNKVLQIIN